MLNQTSNKDHAFSRLTRVILRVIFLCFAVLSFGFPTTIKAEEKDQAQLLVFVASSLAPVMESLGKDFTNRTGVEVVFSYGSSASLARQISNGAPAQVFITADDHWLNWLEAEVKGKFSSHPIAANQIVLAAKADINLPHLKATSKTEDFKNLLDHLPNKTIAIADFDTVPLGRYSVESLLSLGLKDMFAPHTIHTNSAQANLRFLTTGSVSMAIIYKSDLRLAASLQQVFAFPSHAHKNIVYQASILPDHSSEHSMAFINYLKTMEAKFIFIHYGFEPINTRINSEQESAPSQ